MPHMLYIAEHGLAHFEPSMRALHALTQRFTAEFAIRPFLRQHPDRTLQQRERWTRDPNEHVLRLVCEGTRPRRPWAPRLPAFQHDPRPVLRLLRHWIVRHALRWAVKQGDVRAPDLLGFAGKAAVRVDEIRIEPDPVPPGGAVELRFVLHNSGDTVQDLLVDLKAHYVKANGSTSAKVFRLKSLQLGCRDTAWLRKKLMLADLAMRRHFPGVHRIQAMVNGQSIALGSFTISGPGRSQPTAVRS